ncbi:MAG: LysM peptidoglycan-binding domain-containing protein [Burkholderiales bacterium]|nr:LysM peptidoglycan-binding domain-containing protein [Burkholderiales bacterium]
MVPAAPLGPSIPDEAPAPVPAPVATDEQPAQLSPAEAQANRDLWERIRAGFKMAPLDSPLVLQHEDWYSSRPDYIGRFVDRGALYLHHIVEEVEKRGMPMEIALLPVIESAFNPGAYSRAAAAGMWQFIPSTGKLYGLDQNWWADHRRDVVASTHAALNYLEKLYNQFESWELALAAYNCGEGCVARAIAKNEKRKKPTDYLSLDLPKETKHYVPKLMAVKNIIQWPSSYGIKLDAIPDEPYFTRVAAPPKIDVKLAAKLAEMPEDEFVALNPAFNKPVASIASGHLLLPVDKAPVFRENLENYDKPLVSWSTYSAKRGESVDQIARRHGVSPAYLRQVNGRLKERKGRLSQPMLLMVPAQQVGGFVKASLDLPAVAPASAASDGPTTYRVRPGDSLYTIAQRHDLEVDDLREFNNLRGNHLAVGQTLRLTGHSAPLLKSTPIPTAKVAAAPAKVAAPAPKQVETAANMRTYTIRAGDTLFSIAQRFGIALDDLLRWNNLTAQSVIQPGRQVRISA